MNEEFKNVQEEPVTEVTENTDGQTVEEIDGGIELTDTAPKEEEKEVKKYAEEDLEKIVNDRINAMLPKKIEREKRKLEREYREELLKYKEAESILSAGLGTKDIVESNKKMREFYKEQGVDIPAYQKPTYSKEEEEILAKAEADKIIELGYDEMKEEANRLATIGYDNMSNREKSLFTNLTNRLETENKKIELAKLGVKEDLFSNDEFKNFASKFNKNTPIKEVYEMYAKIYQPKPKVEQIGSLKNNDNTSNEVKDYYSPEEASKFTRKDYDKNPKLLEAVEKSMPIWYKNQK